MAEQPPPSPAPETAFLRRVLIVAAVVALALLLWAMRGALLLLFGAVVIAVLLLAAARPFRDRLGLSHGLALAAGGGSVLAVLALATWLVGSQVRAQIADLGQRLPEAAQSLERRFGIEITEGILEAMRAIGVPLDQIWGRIGGIRRAVP